MQIGLSFPLHLRARIFPPFLLRNRELSCRSCKFDVGQCSPEILTPKQQLALFMAAREHKNRTPLAPLSSDIFFAYSTFFREK